jgi:rod shape-determining protein MreC
MHKIFNFFLRFREYFILFIAICISLSLISQNNNTQIKQIRSSSIQILGFLQENFSSFFNSIWIPHIISISKENKLLREYNLNLSEEVSRLREASLENLRLRSLLNFKQQSKYNLVSAKVVAKSLILARNFITLDVGSDDGISLNMPIITDKGLVGKVVTVSKNYSQGQVLKNKDFKASVINERSRVNGILAWEGGEDFVLEEVAKNLDVKTGDLIITSDFSSVFPPKIPVGVVTNINYNTGNLFQHIQIKSNVDINTLEEVFVLIFPPDTSRASFEHNIIK